MPAAEIAIRRHLLGKHPRVGDVAVQARREHEQQNAHFVALAAEVLAGEPVPQLVQNFHDGERDRQDGDVFDRKKLASSAGSVAAIEPDDHHADGSDHHQHTEHEIPRAAATRQRGRAANPEIDRDRCRETELPARS